jgi:hypothetical protein
MNPEQQGMEEQPAWLKDLQEKWDRGELCWNGNKTQPVSFERIRNFLMQTLTEERQQYRNHLRFIYRWVSRLNGENTTRPKRAGANM